MKFQYAVALLKNNRETILGVFNTKEEADRFGRTNRISRTAGLQYCFGTTFLDGVPVGNRYRIFGSYNA